MKLVKTYLKFLIFISYTGNVMANDHLTDLQKYVIFENGTERPFDNEYWNNKKDGIYVDIVSGKPLFSSTDKFDSKTGWPSFTKPITQEAITSKSDYSHSMNRIEARSTNSDIHLGHIFTDGPKEKGGMRYCINSAALEFIAKEDLEKEGYGEYLYLFQEKPKHKYQKAILAGGCFWGMEELLSKQEGVTNVVNGYTGGNIANPTYELVSSGLTNHAEATEVTFDPQKISYTEILKFFFTIHDPTTLNRQGNDVGSQYRSAIFYANERQYKTAKYLIKQANASGVFKEEIVTSLEKLAKFYPAEAYHQDYLQRNPGGYSCHRIRKDWQF